MFLAKIKTLWIVANILDFFKDIYQVSESSEEYIITWDTATHKYASLPSPISNYPVW